MSDDGFELVADCDCGVDADELVWSDAAQDWLCPVCDDIPEMDPREQQRLRNELAD